MKYRNNNKKIYNTHKFFPILRISFVMEKICQKLSSVHGEKSSESTPNVSPPPRNLKK
jgi:hypothetical protein